MSFSSFVAGKCLEYLLSEDADRLRQQTARRKTPLRPPWPSAAETFRIRCTGCGDCAAACPQAIIALDEHSFPIIDFSRNFCTFCGQCAKSCATEALHFDAEKRPWDVIAAVDGTCLLAQRVLCRSCGDRCENRALFFAPGELRPPAVIAEKCSGCGACGSVCPTGAIFFVQSAEREQ